MEHEDSIRIPELLAPAGGPDAFYAAVAGGADAIYCGLGSDFNARRGAGNFTEDEFRTACRAAHLAGTRVYVTVNVVIKQQEMPAALALVKRAWELGADAFIIQDWGLLAQIRTLWPEVECHISTQANVHDPEGVAWCRSLGADRVTLSRELSLEEISAIHEQERRLEDGCELEVFGHGALCFCYSGVCMMSSMRALTDNVRSANRGMCAQPCRLPYELVDASGRVLSAPGRTRPLCPKDACMVEDLPSMAAAGVSALKIEGRMKAPDYVHSVISTYREAIDADDASVSGPVWAERLLRAFNRSFTDAYLKGTSGDELMSYERSNNRGSEVGVVVSSVPLGPERTQRGGSNGGRIRQKTVTPAETRIRLDKYVERGDLLEIRHEDDVDAYLTAPVREDAPAGETIRVRTARPMPEGATVRLIRSQRSLDAASRVIAKAQAGEAVRKRAVNVRAVARIGEPFRIELSCEPSHADRTVASGAPVKVSVEGPRVEAARTRSVSAEDLAEHIGRMGSTPFEMASFVCELDEGVGMGFSMVHELRAKACDELSSKLLSAWEGRALILPRKITNRKLKPLDPPSPASDGALTSDGRADPTEPHVSVIAQVSTPSAARAALAAGADGVYAAAIDLASHEGWPEGVVPVLSEVYRAQDKARTDACIHADGRVVCGNVGELSRAHATGCAAEVAGCIPVHNIDAAQLLVDNGADTIWFSPELTLAEIRELAPAIPASRGMKVFGYERLMTSEHCILQVADRCIHDCAHCTLRRRSLFLRDENGALLPVSTDLDGRSRIWFSEPFDAVPQLKELLEAGVDKLLVDGTLLEDSQIGDAVARVRAALGNVARGGDAPARKPNTTEGHLFAPIQ